MFSTGSSPQTDPTSPESSSNNSDEILPHPDSWGQQALYAPNGEMDDQVNGDYCGIPLGDLIHDSLIS
jgi:hypothetical protein